MTDVRAMELSEHDRDFAAFLKSQGRDGPPARKLARVAGEARAGTTMPPVPGGGFAAPQPWATAGMTAAPGAAAGAMSQRTRALLAMSGVGAPPSAASLHTRTLGAVNPNMHGGVNQPALVTIAAVPIVAGGQLQRLDPSTLRPGDPLFIYFDDEDPDMRARASLGRASFPAAHTVLTYAQVRAVERAAAYGRVRETLPRALGLRRARPGDLRVTDGTNAAGAGAGQPEHRRTSPFTRFRFFGVCYSVDFKPAITLVEVCVGGPCRMRNYFGRGVPPGTDVFFTATPAPFDPTNAQRSWDVAVYPSPDDVKAIAEWRRGGRTAAAAPTTTALGPWEVPAPRRADVTIVVGKIKGYLDEATPDLSGRRLPTNAPYADLPGLGGLAPDATTQYLTDVEIILSPFMGLPVDVATQIIFAAARPSSKYDTHRQQLAARRARPVVEGGGNVGGGGGDGGGEEED